MVQLQLLSLPSDVNLAAADVTAEYESAIVVGLCLRLQLARVLFFKVLFFKVYCTLTGVLQTACQDQYPKRVLIGRGRPRSAARFLNRSSASGWWSSA